MIRPGGWVNRRWLWLLSNGRDGCCGAHVSGARKARTPRNAWGAELGESRCVLPRAVRCEWRSGRHSWYLASFGLPHSSHSSVVRGMDGSHIVTIRSTNGTPATAAQKREGASLTTLPTSSPPAERPSHESAPRVATPLTAAARAARRARQVCLGKDLT